MRSLTALVALLAALILVACGGDEEGDEGGQVAQQATEAEERAEDSNADRDRDRGRTGAEDEKPGLTIATGDSQFGEVLFDADERAIYYFDKEATSKSECYGECADAWPPVLTEGEPRAGGGAEQGLLGTTKRDDGTTQVTYDGRPLYYYHDEPAGQVLCHNVDEFGGLWLAVQPDGAAVA